MARAIQNPVTILFDGEKIRAEKGEPVAAALVAAGRIQIARSPKYHRPRGPACFRGACDGCLARVDGEPNVMTCLCAAHEGCTVESQNVLGARKLDLLRMTDWFFPEGFNHHELFAGVPAVEKVMQVFARRVAGLGKVPEKPVAPRKAERRDIDVLVVGAGPAGMMAALALEAKGRRVEVIDDAIEPGGSALALDEFAPVSKAFRDRMQSTRAVAAGIYGDDVLVVSEEGASIVHARTVVLAPGAHDGTLAFEGNDLPGIMSARAGAMLARRGIEVGKHAVAVVAGGDGKWARSLEGVEVIEGTPIAAKGSSRVKGITVKTPFEERTLDCDALFIDAPRAPAYELCAQAGAKLRHEPRGFVVESMKIRDGFFALGEVLGTTLDRDALDASVESLLAAI